MKNYIISINFANLKAELEENFGETSKEIWEKIKEILEKHGINVSEQVEYKPIGVKTKYTKWWSSNIYSSELELKVKDFDIDKVIDDFADEFGNVMLIEED